MVGLTLILHRGQYRFSSSFPAVRLYVYQDAQTGQLPNAGFVGVIGGGLTSTGDIADPPTKEK